MPARRSPLFPCTSAGGPASPPPLSPPPAPSAPTGNVDLVINETCPVVMANFDMAKNFYTASLAASALDIAVHYSPATYPGFTLGSWPDKSDGKQKQLCAASRRCPHACPSPPPPLARRRAPGLCQLTLAPRSPPQRFKQYYELYELSPPYNDSYVIPWFGTCDSIVEGLRRSPLPPSALRRGAHSCPPLPPSPSARRCSGQTAQCPQGHRGGRARRRTRRRLHVRKAEEP